jgi:hypothetical protein
LVGFVWLVSFGWFRLVGFVWLVSFGWFRLVGFVWLVSFGWFRWFDGEREVKILLAGVLR